MDRLLGLIPTLDIPEAVVKDDEVLNAALAAVKRICELSGSVAFRQGLLESLLRILETYLLADAKLLELSRYWDSYLGRERELIRTRVKDLLGVEPTPILVDYLRACAQARTWQFAATTTAPQRTVWMLFQRTAADHPRQELRCASCGYHFREDDMGADRLELVHEFRLVLAASIDPRRKEDPLKPVLTRGEHSRSLTELSIDHIVPVAGFGSSELENLRFLCQFCNGGKLAYRRPLEPLSALVAASLSGFPVNRPHSLLRQLAVTSAIAARGRCAVCSHHIRNRELTVQLNSNDVPHRWWLVPWTLQIVCYECWSGPS